MNLHSSFRVATAATLLVLLVPIASFATDTVEFLNGSTATGTVKQIRKAGKEFEDRFKGRARDRIEATRIYDQLDVSKVSDGTYSAGAIGYAGRMDLEVQVRGGRIESVEITSHKEKRHYKAMTEIPDKIVDKQSIQGIDAVSGATVTSQAIVNATAKALAKAMR